MMAFNFKKYTCSLAGIKHGDHSWCIHWKIPANTGRNYLFRIVTNTGQGNIAIDIVAKFIGCYR